MVDHRDVQGYGGSNDFSRYYMMICILSVVNHEYDNEDYDATLSSRSQRTPKWKKEKNGSALRYPLRLLW